MSIKKIITGAAILLLVACGDKLTVSSDFSKTADIEKGREVFFDSEVVGKITKVDNQENKTKVMIELSGGNVKKIDASAAVVINRLKEGSPLEIYNRNTKTGELKDGQKLKGLDSMFELGAWMVGDAINLGSGTLSGYVEAFQTYLDSDKFDQDKAQVQEQIQQAGEAAKEAIKTVNQDVNKAVEDLSDSEGDAAKAVEQLGEELAPLAAELGKSGTAILQELEKLSKNLEQKDEDNQQVGTGLLESLLAMLENLNKSLQVEQEQQVDEVEEVKQQTTEQ